MKLLIIDDDALVLDSIRMMLPSQWELTTTSQLTEDLPNDLDVALIDMHLTPHSKTPEGPQVIKKLSTWNPHLELIAISGDLDRQLMEECLKNGASRFLAKPLSAEELRITLEKIEALKMMKLAVNRSSQKMPQWIGKSPAAEKIQKQIANLTGEAGPLLIAGESGTGKEVVAHLLHQSSQGPMVKVNIAAIPESLFESEVFGHVKGAFTGADQNKIGLAEAAQGGDLFFDEIEALSPQSQVKLLRFLESGELRRVGSSNTVQVKARVILATNEDLEKKVKEGLFREDLLWRINGKKIQLPPLRERPEDIPLISKYFLDQERPKKNKTLGDDAIASLKDYSWPGNVRELKRACEQLALLSPLPIIRREDVQALLKPQSPSSPIEAQDLSLGLGELTNRYEAQIIRLCLKKEGDIDKVAKTLQISRSSLYKKIREYQIEY